VGNVAEYVWWRKKQEERWRRPDGYKVVASEDSLDKLIAVLSIQFNRTVQLVKDKAADIDDTYDVFFSDVLDPGMRVVKEDNKYLALRWLLNKDAPTNSAFYVGLFWFSKDYSSVEMTAGMREVTKSDIVQRNRVDPVGLHAEHDAPRDQPRGRVFFNDGEFQVWVGEDCPLTDEEVANLVKKEFALRQLESIKVRRHYHWNTKDS